MGSLFTYITIDGEYVSPWALSIRSEMCVDSGATSNVNQCDLVLANPGGRFDGHWNVNSVLVVVLISKEYSDEDNASIYSKLVFTGKLQSITPGYLELTIKAGCDLKVTSSVPEYDIHAHGGVTTLPIIQQLCDHYKLKPGEIFNTDIEKREWFFMGDRDGRGIFDELGKWDGCETYINESGLLEHKLPYPDHEHESLTGRMKSPQSAQSTKGYCNQLYVRGGSAAKSSDPKSAFRTTDALEYLTTDDDLADCLCPPNIPTTPGGTPAFSAKELADRKAALKLEHDNYGVIRAPDYIFPDLNQLSDVIKRAKNLLATYVTQKNAFAFPAVIGRAPELNDIVHWQVRRQQGDGGWIPDAVQSGQVCRRRDEASGKSGWVTYIEVHPYTLDFHTTGSTGPSDPNAPKKKTYEDIANAASYDDLDGNHYMRDKGPNGWGWVQAGEWLAGQDQPDRNWVDSVPSEVQNNYDSVVQNGIPLNSALYGAA